MWPSSKAFLCFSLLFTPRVLGRVIASQLEWAVLSGHVEMDVISQWLLAVKQHAAYKPYVPGINDTSAKSSTFQAARELSPTKSAVTWTAVLSLPAAWSTMTTSNDFTAVSPLRPTTAKAESATINPTHPNGQVRLAQRRIHVSSTADAAPSPLPALTTFLVKTTTAPNAKERRATYEIAESQLLALGITSFPPSSPTTSPNPDLDASTAPFTGYYIGSISYEVPYSALSALGITTFETSTMVATTMTTSASAASET